MYSWAHDFVLMTLKLRHCIFRMCTVSGLTICRAESETNNLASPICSNAPSLEYNSYAVHFVPLHYWNLNKVLIIIKYEC